MYRVMVVDDEPANLESLARILRSDGAEVTCFQDPREAMSDLRRTPVDIILTDLRMNSLDGMAVLETSKVLDPSIEVIVMTAYGTVEIAVNAMKKGAYDFVTKPLSRVSVLKTIHRALERKRLMSENASLREELRSQTQFDSQAVIGKSDSIRTVLEVAKQAALSRANVLIEGESGTGKGLIAEFIHRSGETANANFVKINCTAIPENLLEAELFGFEAGAFTGAQKRKKGRVELSDGGTLFLDEVGIAPLSLQAKLLRFVQEGEFERLGSNETLKVRTRVIAATNSDLKQLIRSGGFREDLYYRLNVINLTLPPLRNRREDIALLAQKFVEEAAKKNSRHTPKLDAQAIEALTQYDWPGNIRELQNAMERAVVLNRSGVIQASDLPADIVPDQGLRSFVVSIGLSLRDIEKKAIEETLRFAKGDKRVAAALLGIHPRTIYRFLEAIEEKNTPEKTMENEVIESGSI